MEDLYKFIEVHNIEVIYADLKDANGLYVNDNGVDIIFINKKVKKVEELKCILIEELIHYKVGVYPTSAFCKDYCERLQRSKNERRAFKCVINELIPIDKFKSFLEQDKTKFEIAEELEISEELLDKAFDLYT